MRAHTREFTIFFDSKYRRLVSDFSRLSDTQLFKHARGLEISIRAIKEERSDGTCEERNLQPLRNSKQKNTLENTVAVAK